MIRSILMIWIAQCSSAWYYYGITKIHEIYSGKLITIISETKRNNGNLVERQIDTHYYVNYCRKNNALNFYFREKQLNFIAFPTPRHHRIFKSACLVDRSKNCFEN